jgi:hypothetical protein
LVLVGWLVCDVTRRTKKNSLEFAGCSGVDAPFQRNFDVHRRRWGMAARTSDVLSSPTTARSTASRWGLVGLVPASIRVTVVLETPSASASLVWEIPSVSRIREAGDLCRLLISGADKTASLLSQKVNGGYRTIGRLLLCRTWHDWPISGTGDLRRRV